MLDALYDWHRTIYSDLQRKSHFVTATAEAELAQEGPSRASKLAVTSTEPGDRSAKVPENPVVFLSVCLHLLGAWEPQAMTEPLQVLNLQDDGSQGVPRLS